MIRKIVILGVMIAWAVILLSAVTLPAQDKMFSYDYSFKPGTEPDGFRGIKWQTDSATLDPLHTMEVISMVGPFIYYKKNKEDLHLVTVKLDDIIYEFWNGKFSGVIIRVKGEQPIPSLERLCFCQVWSGTEVKSLGTIKCPGFLL